MVVRCTKSYPTERRNRTQMFAKILYLERTPQQKFLDRFRKILNQKMKTKPVIV